MLKERVFTHFARGGETWVHSHKKGDREGRTVIKDMDGSIDDGKKEALTGYHQRIREIYGADIIPRQKFIRDANNPGKWLIVQEKIELAEYPNIMEQRPGDDFPELVRERLKTLVQELKKSLIKFESVDNSSERPFLDLFSVENLLITKDNTVKYVDSGDPFSDISTKKYGLAAIYEVITSRIALLELIIEGHLNLSDDPVYRGLFDYYIQNSEFFKVVTRNDPQELYKCLKNLELMRLRN